MAGALWTKVRPNVCMNSDNTFALIPIDCSFVALALNPDWVLLVFDMHTARPTWFGPFEAWEPESNSRGDICIWSYDLFGPTWSYLQSFWDPRPQRYPLADKLFVVAKRGAARAGAAWKGLFVTALNHAVLFSLSLRKS
ncbi:hypothetical protein BC939DRAFT_478560 [Gamsiella multidivaricata]|uniref:uncharacterized protein n=1 Tax=Gamsiella multidivaricata TaxID=101098 RepID=UPI00221EC58B|nr:uncharacterized protein BC939DRAFT_478560 [Gamsiella multidivaricata]KAI7820918.1 hypothetical protein BC939DRAFT_478560 [Gamsiella multidivaricata]